MLFLGAQLVDRRQYTLSTHRIVRTRQDGTQLVKVSLTESVRVGIGFEAVLRDMDGNIKIDTRAERVRAKRELAARVTMHLKNPLVVSLIESHRAAVDEPHIELIRLYEIRDALAKHFGKKTR
jgi:hypothetical protein